MLGSQMNIPAECRQVGSGLGGQGTLVVVVQCCSAQTRGARPRTGARQSLPAVPLLPQPGLLPAAESASAHAGASGARGLVAVAGDHAGHLGAHACPRQRPRTFVKGHSIEWCWLDQRRVLSDSHLSVITCSCGRSAPDKTARLKQTGGH